MNTVLRFLIPAVLLTGLVACGQNGPADLTEEPAFVQAGEPFQLRPGGTARLGDLLIGFRGISSDSRCPEDVVCVWAGDAVARIQVTVGRMAWTPYDLHTTLQPHEIEFREWKIRLVGVEPATHSERQIRPDQYIITLEVTR
jgi:hypothetical protein